MTGLEPHGEPEIVVVDDADAASLSAAAYIAARIQHAVEERGRADWATTGGSNPVGIYRAMMDTPIAASIPWDRTHVWWGDDRYVPRDHALSNVKPFDEIVLRISPDTGGTAGVPLPLDQVHPFPTTEAIGGRRGNDWCATALAQELMAADLPDVEGWPSFDLILVGIGGDGHLFSVFPASPAIGALDLALGIPAPTHIEPHVPRVTLNPAVLGAARDLLVVVLGESKADLLADVFGRWDPRRLPAQFARRTGATWILDEAAAAGLPR